MRKIKLNKNIKDSSMFQAATEVISILKDNGFAGVIAGGAVRDILLGHEPHDVDIATDARPEEIEFLFPRTVPVGKQFGIIVVLHKNEEFECATFQARTHDYSCKNFEPKKR